MGRRDAEPKSRGFRRGDDLLIACATRYHWPPEVTRRQRMRDLRLLAMRWEYEADERDEG